VTEPVALGLIEAPGKLGADIVVGEGQALGVGLQFGGPYLGLFGCREKYVRQMPGRLCGQTVDATGKRGFVLTLSTREQHIRREKATSNICTNAGLCALAFSIHMTLLGGAGLAKLARVNHARAQQLAARLAAVLGGIPDPAAGLTVEDPRTGFLERLFWVNAFLVGFNLIPAFPMDGGRVLRAALALRMGHRQATQLAARIGQGLAFALGLLGLFGAPLLIFIALFVYLGAAGEAAEEDLRTATRGLAAEDAMETRFEALPPEADVGTAAEALLRTPQQDFPVVDGAGRLMGLLTRDAIILALRQAGPATPVADAMRGDIPRVGLRTPLDQALQVLSRDGGVPAVAVQDDAGRLAGLITPANIADLIAVRAPPA